MNENQTTNSNQNVQNSGAQPPQPASFVDQREEWREQRRAWRQERRASRGTSGAWIGGAVLILLGLVFLLQNFGIMILHNWWALFILIPAFGAFAGAYTIYRGSGNRLTYPARGSLIGGIFFTLLAAAFLFDVNVGLFWPVLLILAGVGLLLNFIIPS